jgi:hypothetical protein
MASLPASASGLTATKLSQTLRYFARIRTGGQADQWHPALFSRLLAVEL